MCVSLCCGGKPNQKERLMFFRNTNACDSFYKVLSISLGISFHSDAWHKLSEILEHSILRSFLYFVRYLFIVRSNNIDRYNLETGMLDQMLESGNFPQGVSADTVGNAIYWINFNLSNSNNVVMKTSYIKETISLNISFTSELSITQDMLHIYVLVQDTNTIHKYKKTTLEKVDSIPVTSGTKEIIVVYGMHSIAS